MHQPSRRPGAARAPTRSTSCCSTRTSARSLGGWRCWWRRWLQGAPISSMVIAGPCRRGCRSAPFSSAAIDRAVAVLPRVRWTRSAWGGSLAFTRNALAALDLPNTIGHALTEDLPIGDRAAQTGLRVLTRRAIRPPTPLAGNLRDVWRFARRQYQLIRLYRPGLWCFAAFVVTTDLAARIALLSNVLRLGGRLARHPRSRPVWARPRPRFGRRSAGNSA